MLIINNIGKNKLRFKKPKGHETIYLADIKIEAKYIFKGKKQKEFFIFKDELFSKKQDDLTKEHKMKEFRLKIEAKEKWNVEIVEVILKKEVSWKNYQLNK